MSKESAPQVFISYSRKDSEIVEKLAASLLVMGFSPWVDRDRIEGGDDWEQRIRDAIVGSAGFVLVLTPDAMRSPWVRDEFSRARDQGKFILSLLVKELEVADKANAPLGLERLQHIDMRGDYDTAIQQVAKALRRGAKRPSNTSEPESHQRPKPGRSWFSMLAPRWPGKRSTDSQPRLPSEEINRLYWEACGLLERQPVSSDDLERAARLLEDIVADDPKAVNGRAKGLLANIEPQLRSARQQHLTQAIEQARSNGDWRQEYALWNALTSFRKLTSDESARVELAKHNQKYQEFYADTIVGLVAKKSYSAAASDLEILWRDAKEYGDPAGLAATLRANNIVIYTPQEQAKRAEIKQLLNQARKKASDAADAAAQLAAAASALTLRAATAVDVATKAESEQKTEESQQIRQKAIAVKGAVEQAIGSIQSRSSIATQAAQVAQATSDPQEAESAEQRAEAAYEAARQANDGATRGVADVESELVYNGELFAWKERKRRYEQEMRTVPGYVDNIFDGAHIGVWGATACLLVSLSALAAVVSHSLVVAESIVAALAILGYAAYWRVVRWATYILIAALCAVVATLLVPLSAQLTTPPIHAMTSVGFGAYSLSLGNGATVVSASIAAWALVCGPIGVISGVLIGINILFDRSSDDKPVGCGAGLGILALSAILGAVAGGVCGSIIAAIVAFPVLELGWLYGGLIIGAVTGMLAGISLTSHEWRVGAQIGMGIGIVAGATLMIAALFVWGAGQSVGSVVVWAGGALWGALVSIGFVWLVVIVQQARLDHPFPEKEPLRRRGDAFSSPYAAGSAGSYSSRARPSSN